MPELLPLPPEREATWVESPSELRSLAARLESVPRVALDTEANSLHAYHERTCIVQVSVPQEDAIVDALAFDDLDPLRDALDRDDVEVVMHGGDYDVSVLTRDFGFRFDRVFDTMIAATILDLPALGLAALVQDQFGVTLNKRFQRANWGRRPITDEQRLYLQRDTIYLLALRNHLATALEAEGLTEVASIEFRRLAKRRGKVRSPDPEAWRRIKGSNKLDAEGRCVLRALHKWREGVAKSKNLPAFKVFSPRSMMALASTPPRRARHPKDLPFLGAKERVRYGRAVLAAVQRGLEQHAKGNVPPARAPSLLSPDEAQRLRGARKVEDRIRAWRRKEATTRKVPNLVILPNPAMEWLARHRPKTLEGLRACDDIGPERIQRYGDALLELVHPA